jgi:hypothetical protein
MGGQCADFGMPMGSVDALEHAGVEVRSGNAQPP